MLSPEIREKLKDETYLTRHLAAMAALRKIRNAPWYDAHFLRFYEVAQHYLSAIAPQELERFVAGFDAIRPDRNCTLEPVARLFDEDTRDEIKQVVTNLTPAQLESHEEDGFGRAILHDHPFFSQLQQQIIPLVSDLAGRELAIGYNFLCLYGDQGRCDLHMDEPRSMYTLDYCIDQSVDWPIHFSDCVDWPDAHQMQSWTPQQVLDDPQLGFASRVIEPGSAILFTGSSQWHYRDPIPAGNFCQLLFFHFYPAGYEQLVKPALWHSYFDMPLLEPLCDLFEQGYRTVQEGREEPESAVR